MVILVAGGRRRFWVRAFSSDRFGVLVLALASLVRGCAYLPGIWPPNSARLHPVEQWVNIGAWGFMWACAGVFGVYAASVSYRALLALALGANVSLNLLWGVSYAVAAWQGHVSITGGLTYGLVVVLALWAVWRGSRYDLVRVVEGGG